VSVFDQAFSRPEHQPFFWRREGTEQAALLVHGFPGTPADVLPVAEALHSAGWDVQGILLPGFGSQIDTLSERRADDWLLAICEALAELKREYSTVLLVGYSMGGALSMQAAALEPPTALVLLAPFWKIDNVLWAMLPAIHRVVPEVPIFSVYKLDFDDPHIRAELHNFVPGVDADDPQVRQAVREYRLPLRILNEVRAVGAAGYRAVPRIFTRTLIVQGTQDPLVIPALTRRLVKRFPRYVEYIEVPADHLLTNTQAAAWPDVRQSVVDFAELAISHNVR
jgi:carboxylesterase